MSDKETIEVQRRRKGTGPEGKPRAKAPERKQRDSRPSASGGPPTSRPPSTQRPVGGGGLKLPLWLVIPLVIIIILVNLFTGGGDEPLQINESEYQEEVAEVVFPTAAPLDVSEIELPPPSSQDQTWLVMLYQDADDKILEKDIYIDLNEAEKVGSSDRVHIVSQVDRFKSGYAGDGDWKSTRRYYITRDNNLNQVGSQLIEDLGEVNMADGRSLVDFVTWAVSNFPADKHVLILSDHGMGWPGGWSDPSPGGRDQNKSPLASKLGEHLYLSEIDHALAEIIQKTGIGKFEVIGFDACLMAQLEVFSAIEPYARYAIASEETEPALGWAYTGFLETLIDNPDMDGAQLSRNVIDSYISEDQRIVDPVAREEFAAQGSPLGALFGFGRATPEQLTQQLGKGVTLSAVDLGLLPELLLKVNEFAYLMQNDDQAVVASARTYARSYTSIFGREVPESFIDLGHFTQLVARETRRGDIQAAAEGLLSVLRKVVIAEKHGQGKTGSSGISIYFPNSTLYRSPMAGPQSYTEIADRFSSVSLWDDFLAFHYQNQSFELDTALSIPVSDAPTRSPGSGSISVSPILVSSEIARPGEPVELSVDIEGENIGYIKLFVGYYDRSSNSIYYADTDFLESPDSRELDGVYYPKWGQDGEFTLKFSWDPYIFAITDGYERVPTLFTPETYGETAVDAIYSVDGLYTFMEDGDTRYARLYFRDGILRQVFGFTGVEEVGAPREIIPQSGDQFTILDQWMELDSDGNLAKITPYQGETLTFGDEMFRWEEIYAAPGLYVIGFIIEDLDGHKFPIYTQLTVE